MRTCVLLLLALPVLAETWTLPNGTVVTGKQVEATTKVVVVEDGHGKRHVIAKEAARANHGGMLQSDLNPQVSALWTKLQQSQSRLDTMWNAGQLEDARYHKERKALQETYLKRLEVMHPELSAGELRARLKQHGMFSER